MSVEESDAVPSLELQTSVSGGTPPTPLPGPVKAAIPAAAPAFSLLLPYFRPSSSFPGRAASSVVLLTRSVPPVLPCHSCQSSHPKKRPLCATSFSEALSGSPVPQGRVAWSPRLSVTWLSSPAPATHAAAQCSRTPRLHPTSPCLEYLSPLTRLLSALGVSSLRSLPSALQWECSFSQCCRSRMVFPLPLLKLCVLVTRSAAP